MRIPIAALLLAFTACATPYQPMPPASNWIQRGYSETQLGDDIYDVYFKVASSEEERARDFVMLRSAEICQSHSFRYFFVMENNVIGRSNSYSLIGIFDNDSPISVKNRIKCINEELNGKEFETAVIQEIIRSKYNFE